MYSFILIFAGISVILLPFYKINICFLIVQIIVALFLFGFASKLFYIWGDKKAKRNILLSRNRKEFRPDTFEVYMQAPCGRLIVRSVLKELGKSNEYKNLLKMKKPFWVTAKENCTPVKTVVYINENFNARS